MICEKCGSELKESKVKVTKEIVVKRLKEGYYAFSSEEVNEEFRADLKEIDFDLREADLQEADLREADLREADLREADLREANLWKANLWKADLNAIFYNTKVTKEQRKYIMEETDLFEVIENEEEDV